MTDELKNESAPPREKAKRVGPKWEAEARERLTLAVRRFTKPLNELNHRMANEGDTRLLVTDFLCEALGFDKYADLTTEYQVKGEFADYGIRIDGEMVAFIEVKRVGTKLGAKQLRQVESYAVNEGVEWLILTNGADWQVFHLSGGLPIEVDHVFSVCLTDGSPVAEKVDRLFYLTRESLKRRQIDDVWKARRATSPDALAKIILSDPIAAMIRKEVKRTSGYLVDQDELVKLLKSTVLRDLDANGK